MNVATLKISLKIYHGYRFDGFSKVCWQNPVPKPCNLCYKYTMSVVRAEKIRSLLNQWEAHTVATAPRLRALGISSQDVQKYVANRWLESIGHGAFKRPSETVTWQGALYSVQTQLGLSIHVAALTALDLLGHSHYQRLGDAPVYLFSPPHISLPAWFKKQSWSGRIRHTQSKFLPADLGLSERRTDEGFTLRIASPERALLEMLHLAPHQADLIEVSQIAEGMLTLRPSLMQSLLEACGSVKVKRLFLYLAERNNLPVMAHLDVTKFDLGTGDRSLTKAGGYVPKYQLLLPRELVVHGS